MSTLFAINHMKINKISPLKHKFLQILQCIDKMPESLYFTGTLPDERRPTVAIVGARKPTAYGNEVTRRFAYDLAKQGAVVVSGLALGVDSIAHRATIEAGGMTIAVLPSGLPDIYPASHHGLADQIVTHGGALISEYQPGAPIRLYTFLERNRIVSGLSDAVLITEAAARSGTLNTAMHALQQGKDVFVVPGNITSPLSAGCNALLKQGAMPATCAEDILQVIAPQLLQTQAILPLGTTPLEASIISLLQSGVRDGDELHVKSGVATSELNQALTMLELSGTIRALGGNQWTLV